MHRSPVSLAGVVVLLVGVIATMDRSTTAQEATPSTMGGHPLVGTWLVDDDADDPANAPEVSVFTADGAYVNVDAEGFPNVGVWKATGARTAALTFVVPAEDAFADTLVVRALIEVDETGNATTAQYTIEFVTPDGARSGEYGPGTATSTRITAEEMGTPVGPIAALFAEEGEAAATPQS